MKVREIIRENAIWKPSRSESQEPPLVSVFLPTFRRAKNGLFEDSVNSVRRQTLKNWELIIIDDASTDGTEDIIDKMMVEDHRICSIRHIHNIGLPAISEYEAFRKARGKYIAFMFDDVEWDAEALEKTVLYMEEHRCLASYGIARLITDAAGKYIEIGKPGQLSDEELILTNGIANFTVVLDRLVLEDVGLYDPHLTLTRNCDWDLWIRISKKYELIATGIFFGTEKGYTLSDSLGNSYRLNRWVSTEHFQHKRNVLLRPERFEDYDIVETFGSRSTIYIGEMKKILAQFKEKNWYSQISYAPTVNFNHKYVLVCVKDVDASLLSFERLQSNQITFRYANIIGRDFFPHDICLADAIIIHRDIYKWMEYLPLFKNSGVPLYYYLDDNFSVLAKSGFEDATLSASAVKQEILRNFYGILLSTDSLKKYFEVHALHTNLFIFSPVLPVAYTCMHEIRDREIRVAFMGGSFRYEVLRSCVVPALEKLSQEFIVSLYLPEDIQMDDDRENNLDFYVHYIKRTKILDRALHEYGKNSIDIQVHCGKDTPNNQYKTLNALGNASAMGAVLVASAFPPFTNQPQLIDYAYKVTENTQDAWYQTLLFLAKNPAIRNELVQNAIRFCQESYSREIAEQQIVTAFAQLNRKDFTTIVERYDRVAMYMYTQSNMCGALSSKKHFLDCLRKLKAYWEQYSFGCISIIIKKFFAKVLKK